MKLSLIRKVNSNLSEAKVLEKLSKTLNKRNIEQKNNEIRIAGPVFYNSICRFRNRGDIEIEIMMKKHFLIIFPSFIAVWTIGMIEQEGLVFGIIASILFTAFMIFVNRGLMISIISEIEKTITGYNNGD